MTTLVAFVSSHLIRIRLSLNELLSLSRSFIKIKLRNNIVCTLVRLFLSWDMDSQWGEWECGNRWQGWTKLKKV